IFPVSAGPTYETVKVKESFRGALGRCNSGGGGASLSPQRLSNRGLACAARPSTGLRTAEAQAEDDSGGCGGYSRSGLAASALDLVQAGCVGAPLVLGHLREGDETDCKAQLRLGIQIGRGPGAQGHLDLLVAAAEK